MKILSFFTLFLVSSNLFSQNWSTNPLVNNPIAVSTNGQELSNITSDGKGGAIICWRDFRGGITTDIYAQRITASGSIRWAINGRPICLATGDQYEPSIISDGMGGAIIAWYDTRNNPNGVVGLYVQRIDSNGTALWTNNGVVITPDSTVTDPAHMISDGAGGAIIVWEDLRVQSGITGDIFAQKINASGVVQWQAKGVPVCRLDGDQQYPSIISDKAGGAIIIWEDSRLPMDLNIYAQRINSNGVPQWTVNGIPVSFGFANDQYPVAAENGSGGAIIAWTEGTNTYVRGQNLSGAGILLWAESGAPIDTVNLYNYKLQICKDSAQGAFLCWESLSGPVAVQHLDKDGHTWAAKTLVTTSITTPEKAPQIVFDGANGAIISWEDERNGYLNTSILAQRVNISGAKLWNADGVFVSRASDSIEDYDDKHESRMVSDGKGGAILSWDDLRANDGHRDIYSQRIGLQGIIVPVTTTGFEPKRVFKNKSFKVYPNPLQTESIIEFSNEQKNTRILITDILGNEIRSHQYSGNNFIIEKGELKSGMYFLQIINENNEIFIEKLIVREN